MHIIALHCAFAYAKYNAPARTWVLTSDHDLGNLCMPLYSLRLFTSFLSKQKKPAPNHMEVYLLSCKTSMTGFYACCARWFSVLKGSHHHYSTAFWGWENRGLYHIRLIWHSGEVWTVQVNWQWQGLCLHHCKRKQATEQCHGQLQFMGCENDAYWLEFVQLKAPNILTLQYGVVGCSQGVQTHKTVSKQWNKWPALFNKGGKPCMVLFTHS